MDSSFLIKALNYGKYIHLTYLNIHRMECIKTKNNNTFIFQMHVNSALASIQIPPGTQVGKQMGNQLVGFKTLLG